MFKKYLEEYKRDGITVIPDVFTKKEMEEFKRQAYSIEPEDIIAAGYPHQPFEHSNGHRSLAFFPAIANNHANAVRKSQRLQDIVKAFLGENVKQVNNQIYYREAGDPDEFNWHRDIIFRKPVDRFPNIADHYMQTIIAIDDITEDNGAVEFVLGSTNKDDEFTGSVSDLRIFKRRDLYGKKYTATKGSVLCWRVDLVHGSEANMSKTDRMTYMNGFARAEGCLDYPWYLKDGKVQNIDPALIP